MKKFLNTSELLKYGEEALRIIDQQYKQLEQQPIVPNVEPGFLRNILPKHPPYKPESLSTILEDTKRHILPNLTKWHHPNFYAYFPANTSHATFIADLLADINNAPGFTWVCSPAMTELENIVADWGVQMFGLPEKFLLKNTGGGVILSNVGESLFLTVHAAKIKKMKELGFTFADPQITKLVAYYTETGHVINARGLMLSGIPHKRVIPVHYTNKQFFIKPEDLQNMIEKDKKEGLIPFWCGTTVGATTAGCADPIKEIGQICRENKVWMNIDAAWAGASFVVPEYRDLYLQGSQDYNSIAINFAKWMMSGMSSSMTYFDDKESLNESLIRSDHNAEYLKNRYTDEYDITDYKNWQIGTGKRFHALKFWYIIRTFGIEGLQQNVTDKIELAKEFEKMVLSDERFELVAKRELSLVCFRLIRDKNGKVIPQDRLEESNRKLLNKINTGSRFYLVGAKLADIFFLRVVIGNHSTEKRNLEELWKHIQTCSSDF
jgi:Glutamate decarboxylase and related PLP-dependent proteins